MIPRNARSARQSEHLAQKLHGHCQQPCSPCGIPKNSLRRLQNTLGEINEALHELARPQHEVESLNECLSNCKEVLHTVNVILNSKKSLDRAEVGLQKTSHFQKAIEDACRALIVAFDNLVGFGANQSDVGGLFVNSPASWNSGSTLLLPSFQGINIAPDDGAWDIEPTDQGKGLSRHVVGAENMGSSSEALTQSASIATGNDQVTYELPPCSSTSLTKCVDVPPEVAKARGPSVLKRSDRLVAELGQRVALRRQLAVLSKLNEKTTGSDPETAGQIEAHANPGAPVEDMIIAAAKDSQLNDSLANACGSTTGLNSPTKPYLLPPRPVRRPPPPARRPPPPSPSRRPPPPPPPCKPSVGSAEIKTYMIANMVGQPSPSDCDSSYKLHDSTPPRHTNLQAPRKAHSRRHPPLARAPSDLPSISETSLPLATQDQRHRSDGLSLNVEFGGPLDLDLDLGLQVTAQEFLASTRKVNNPERVARPTVESKTCNNQRMACSPIVPTKVPPVKHRKPAILCASLTSHPVDVSLTALPHVASASLLNPHASFYATPWLDAGPGSDRKMRSWTGLCF